MDKSVWRRTAGWAALAMALLFCASAVGAPVKVTRNSEVSLLYVTAPDCPYCRSWRHLRAGGWSLFQEKPQSKKVQLIEIQKQSLHDRIDASHYPAQYRHVYEQAPKFGNRIPAWILLVDGKPVLRVTGEGNWARQLEPVIIRLVDAISRGNETTVDI